MLCIVVTCMIMARAVLAYNIMPYIVVTCMIMAHIGVDDVGMAYKVLACRRVPGTARHVL